MSRKLSLDPSVNTVGWCVRDDTNGEESWDWGMWELSGLNFKMRCWDLVGYIEEVIGSFDQLLIEWPTYYDSEKGKVAGRQNYTINLAGLGMFVAGHFRVASKNLFLYTAPEWKGNVAKQVTARRFYKLFDVNVNTVDHNAIDATMMLVEHERKLLQL